MTRNRVRVGGWLATVLLVGVSAGCGGDPAPKGDPTPSGPTTSSDSTAPESPGSTFPPEAPLADGPWIPSLSLRLKVPKGFKGEAEFGVTTLRKGDLAITVYDPGSSGDSDLDAAVKTEKGLNFTGKTQVEYGTATVDDLEVQTFRMTGPYEFFKRVAYGFGVDDSDGETRFVVVGFEGEKDPTTQQDTIDSVLASIQWSKQVSG
jgi:hypothetical protein